jgi:hypothetical protein
MFPICRPPLRDCMRDVLDALALRQITKDEAIKRLTALGADYHAAHCEARMIQGGDDNGCGI